jgi:iron complex outermembrane recepter protein
MRSRLALFLASAMLVTASLVRAQDTTTVRRLPAVVTVTRDVGRSPLDLPYAISEVRPDSARPGQSHTLVDQTLMLLPGVTVANRNNPSQDARVSIRGFGARSAFGVRSIRILRDGMPLTLPDGQTPIDYLDLESVGSIEAIRGTASALYGNASGGVIDLRSASEATAPFTLQSRNWLGSYGMQRFSAVLSGTSDRFSYQGNVGRTNGDGYRDYSRQQLTNGYFRAATRAKGTDFAVQLLGLDMPVADNPGALTRAQLDANSRLADSASIRKFARKTVRQLQLGLSALRPFSTTAGSGEVSAQVFGGTRSLYNPLTFAVVDVDRSLAGGGARATVPVVLGLRNRLSVGVDYQSQDDDRRNWANCNAVTTVTAACPALPNEKGVLQLDQRELVSSVGPYLRDEVELSRRVNASAGVRADYVKFQLRDAFLSDGRDDSGTRTLRAISPMFGLVVRVTPLTAVYADVGSAFETPTTTELVNQPDGSAGLNPELKPQYSTTVELGFKGLLIDRVQFDAAIFDIGVRDEIIPFEAPGGNGRTFFRNAGRTRRQGVELQASTSVSALEFDLSYSYSRFRFRDFLAGTTQFAGNNIPGIPLNQLQASATWRASYAFATLESVLKSRIFVNDANTATADGFTVVNARVGGVATLGRPWLSPVVGVQNVFDRRYVGSVAVNAAGTPTTAKFYEPAPGRTLIVGLTLATGR